MLRMDDAVIGISTPLQYRHIRLLRITLAFTSFWPYKEMGEKEGRFPRLYPTFVAILKLGGVISMLVFLINHRNVLTLQEEGHQFITMFLTLMTGSRTLVMPFNPKYRKIMARFMNEFHLFYFKDMSEYARKIHRQIHTYSHVYTLFLFIQMMFGLTLFNLVPMYNNYSNGKLKYEYLYNTTFECPVYFSVPSDATTNRRSYIYLTIFNCYATLLCTTVICMVDACLFLMVFQVYGHYKIILNILKTFPRPAEGVGKNTLNSQMFSVDESKEVSVKLKQCIDYHRLLINFINDMSDSFGPMLFIYYVFHLICCCLLLLECSTMNAEAIMVYGPLTFVIYQQLIQLSLIFELIGISNDRLIDAVYHLPWECMDVSNRKTVLIFMMKSQESIHVKALGVASIGVRSMVAIIKTSVSYFTMLKTLAD